jgi:hypothetical protein
MKTISILNYQKGGVDKTTIAVNLHAEAQETVKMKNIPITKLRNFYESLAKLGLATDTQLSIVKDINREDKYKRLISLYTESKKHFAEYANIDEPFLPDDLDHRKSLPDPDKVDAISTTSDVISVFQERNPEIDVGDSNYSFKYIQREVPTYRITNTKSKAGRKSGSGGIDFIGFNCKNHLPILGEIKVEGDQNTFYALIQLLTYLSELSTPKQIERIIKKNPFENISEFQSKKSFYLYILLAFKEYGKLKEQILTETQKLAVHLEQNIQEIENIVFLKMHPETKIITKI